MSDVVATDPNTAGKRARTKQHNRRAILDAARAVFGEMGYEAASVRDIIRRTPLSVGAFYNYFRSKEEVYEALADDGARRFRPILAAQHDAATDLESYIRGSIEAYYGFLVGEHEAWRIRRPTGERVLPYLRSETPEIQAVFAQVRAAVGDALDRGQGPQVDTDYLAAACIAIAREVGDQMLERRPIDVPAAVEFAVRMILGGIPALPTVDR